MRVVIAVRDKSSVERIAAGALRFGVSAADQIAVISVVNTADVRSWSVLPPALVAQVQQEMKESATIALRSAALLLRSELHSQHISETVLDGDLLPTLQDFLTTFAADLLIIGCSEARPWVQHTANIVASVPCAVLIVGAHGDPVAA